MSAVRTLMFYYGVVSDGWKLLKKYFGTKNHEDNKWAQLVEDAKDYQNKHDCLLARTFAMGVMEQLETDAKEYEHGAG